MMTVRAGPSTAFVVLVALATVAPASIVTPARAAEIALKPEKNPPGDIPDNQVFVTYDAPSGFSIKVPEGWARTDAPAGVTFADKYGMITVSITSAAAAPTLAGAKTGEAADLVKAGHAVKISAVEPVALQVGPAIRISFLSNSDPNPVTDKRIRLENERLLIGSAGRLAIVTLSAPAGADNADQWALIAESFKWR